MSWLMEMNGGLHQLRAGLGFIILYTEIIKK